MILQPKREFLRMGFVGRALAVFCWAGELDVVLDEDAVVKHGDTGGTEDLAVGIEARAVENDVIPLPLARGACGVY